MIAVRPAYVSVEVLRESFVEVNLELDGDGIRLNPSIEDMQASVNGGAVAILKCSKMIEAWDTVTNLGRRLNN